MTISRYRGRYWAVREECGDLVCVCLYRKGAREVVRRLSFGHAPEEPKRRRKGVRA